MRAAVLFVVEAFFIEQYRGNAGGKGKRLVFGQTAFRAARVRDATAPFGTGVSVGEEHAANGEKNDII